MFDLKVPANAGYFLEGLIEVANFDPLPEEIVWAVFPLPSIEPFSNAFAAAGYDKIFILETFGSGLVVMHVAVLFAVVMIALRCTKWKRLTEKPRFKKYWNSMSIGHIVRFLFEGFLELTLAVVIQLYHVDVEEPSYSVYYSFLWTGLMILGLVLVALYVPYVNFKNYKTLESPVFKRRYGDMVVGLKIDTNKDLDEK